MAKAKAKAKFEIYNLEHRDGSRKSRVHSMYDKKGADVAFKFGRGLKLKETTLRSWFVQFKKCGTKVKVA